MTSIDVAAANTMILSGIAPPRYQWIDVRSATEYSSGHIPGAVNIPMEQMEARLNDLLPKVPIVFVCQAGKRARMAAGLVEPCRTDVRVLEGGTAAWRAAGLPLVTTTASRWSLERQVRLIAGLLVVVAILFAVTIHRYWLGLAGVVGIGLTFAGITDVCLMGSLLARLPWNRARTKAQTCGM